MSEEAFKNVQILKGIPVDEFMDTMGMFSAATNMNCVDCHTEDSTADWQKFAKDTPQKEAARRMLRMVNAINKAYFAGTPSVTCYTCHRATKGPRSSPVWKHSTASPCRTIPMMGNRCLPCARWRPQSRFWTNILKRLAGLRRLPNSPALPPKEQVSELLRQSSELDSLPALAQTSIWDYTLVWGARAARGSRKDRVDTLRTDIQ